MPSGPSGVCTEAVSLFSEVKCVVPGGLRATLSRGIWPGRSLWLSHWGRGPPGMPFILLSSLPLPVTASKVTFSCEHRPSAGSRSADTRPHPQQLGCLCSSKGFCSWDPIGPFGAVALLPLYRHYHGYRDPRGISGRCESHPTIRRHVSYRIVFHC